MSKKELNKINDNDIYLYEPDHKYILNNDQKINFKSATEVVGRYFSEFDPNAIAKKLVSTHKSYMHMTEDELKEKWDSLSKKGTDVHKEIEEYIISRKEPSLQMAKVGIEWINNYRMKSDLDLFPEIIVYSKELEIAGTIDLITKDRKTGKYEIIDWKTGKYERVSYKDKMCSHKITSDLMDCKFEKYTLQLSLYRYLLETYYGLKIQSQIIAHIFDHYCEGFIVPYYKSHIEKIVKNKD